MNNELIRALRPVKARIRRNRFLRGAAAGLAAGIGTSVLLQAVSFLVPIPDRGLWAAAAAGAVLCAAALGNVLRPVKNTDAATAADACGLQERAITALEGGDEPIRLLQRQDACNALAGLDVKQIRAGSVKKMLLTALGCTVLLGCLLLVPNPRDSEAEARKALTRTLQEGRQAIARAADEDEDRLTEEKKSELRKITGDLNRELSESRDAADALVALDRAEQRLEQFRQQTAADAMAAADAAAGSESRNGTAEGRSSSAETQATDSASAGTSAQAGSGSQQTAVSAGTALSAAEMKTLQAMAALRTAMNPSALQGSAGAAFSGSADFRNGQSAASAAGGANDGNQTAGGAGEGSTNEEQAGGGSSVGLHVTGNRDPKYKEGQYETIYDPEHISKEKQNVMTDQHRLGSEDSVQLETGPGQGTLSGDVPWSDALQDYAETEARSAERENLTVQERQWVNEYYRLLTEQQ